MLVCNELAVSLGGWIEIDSNVNQGTTVSIYVEANPVSDSSNDDSLSPETFEGVRIQ